MEIKNFKDNAIRSGKWNKPGASFYDRLIKEDNYKALINEAYLIHGPINKETVFSSAGVKYPHHEIKNGVLVVSEPGVRAAYARAKQMGVYRGALKKHIDKHLNELGVFAEEKHITENFEAIMESINETLGTNLHEYKSIEEIQLYHGSDKKINGTIHPANNSSYNYKEDMDYVFATDNFIIAAIFSNSKWDSSMLNLSFYNDELYIIELQEGILSSLYDGNTGYIYSINPIENYKFQRRNKFEFYSKYEVYPNGVTEINDLLQVIGMSDAKIYKYPDKPEWWNNINNENFVESVNSVKNNTGIQKIWFIKSDDGVDNCCIKVNGYDKPMRGRSSMICLQYDNEWKICCKANQNDYGVPGGGWNKGEDPKDAAIRELHEEVLCNVKEVKRMGTLIEYHKEVAEWVQQHVKDPNDWWYGYYSAVFVGIYDGKFEGEVAEEDRESGYSWRLLEEVYNEFPNEYKKAITEYIDQYNMNESFMFESKDVSVIDSSFQKKPTPNYDTIETWGNKEVLKYIPRDWNYMTKKGEILVVDNKLAGFIFVNKSGFIGPLKVVEDFRGFGLSEVLLKDAIEKFGGKSLGVFADNEVALKLYKKFGFEEYDRKEYADGDIAIMMKLPESKNDIKKEMAWIESFVNDEEFRDLAYMEEGTIETPYQLLDWMKPFKYGWFTRGGKAHNGSEGIPGDFYHNFHLQSPQQLTASKVGVCWDFVELERQWFKENNYQFAIFYIILNDARVQPTHTFLVYQIGRHHYWFEYSWEKYRGIHRYGSSDILIKDVIMRHRQEYNDYSSPVSIHWLQDTPKYGITCQQYMRFAANQPKLNYDALPSRLFKENHNMDNEDLEWALNAFMEDGEDDIPPNMEEPEPIEEPKEEDQNPQEDVPPEMPDAEEEQQEEETTTEEEPTPEPKKESLPKQVDRAESSKNGVRRKNLYIAFIEWCKSFNNKNSFGSIFDKDAFHVTYPFVPDEMRYFYRLANPMMCVLAGDLTFFQVAELRKVNSKNPNIDKMMIFASTPDGNLRIFNTEDKKVYKAHEENGQIIKENVLGDTFDLYIQKMIDQGDILNAPLDVNTTEGGTENANN